MATTTNYSWSTPDNTSYVKDGAQSIRTLGSSVDTTLFTALGGAYPGLRLVKKQTVGTAVSSVTVTNAFSATYDNYKIVWTGGASSVTGSMRLALTGITAGYYAQVSYAAFGGGTWFVANNGNIAFFDWIGGTSTNGGIVDMELQNPFTNKFKTGTAVFNEFGTTANNGLTRIYLPSTSSATGFSLSPASGTLTGGTIYVYGYGTS
jgi:hypothetical protein